MQPSIPRKVDITALDDMELVQMACQQDGAAFRTIMQRSNRRLYRIARAIMRDDSEAEDVVQEAYMRAFASLGDFRGESSLATWLSRIVLNEALGRLRRLRPTVDVTRSRPATHRGAKSFRFRLHRHNSIPNAPWLNGRFKFSWNARSMIFRRSFEPCWLRASSRE